MKIEVHMLGRSDYAPTYNLMQEFTAARAADAADQLWICEHQAVFTQGLAGKPDHLLSPGNIPVVATNRGGQVTYHGLGQVVAYPLVDLRRAGYYVKEFVYRLEEAVIRTLAHFGVTGHRVAGAPGIYVRSADPFSHSMLQLTAADLAGLANPVPGQLAARSTMPSLEPIGKIAALGIKVSRHCTYHGVALNVAMDLEPFSRINPCGYAGLQTVDLSTIGVHTTWNEAAGVLSNKLCQYLAP